MTNPNVYIIIISRNEPSIIVAPLLFKGNFSIITEKELCFTAEEIGSFFLQQKIPLSSQALSQLLDVTKGWALAIRLFSSILKRTSNNFEHALDSMKQNILKSLELEAWEGLSPYIQKILVKVSLLSNLPTIPLQEISGNIQFLQMIPELTAFIWFHSITNDFKIHPLYLEFLQSKQSTLSDREKEETFQLAAQWCLDNGFYINAVYYFAKTHQYERIIQVFLSYPFKLAQDTSEYFLGIVNNLEVDDEKQNDPNLLFLKCYFTPLLLTGVGKYKQAQQYALAVIAEWERVDTPLSILILHTSYSNLSYIDMHLCVVTHQYKGAYYLRKSIEYSAKGSFSNQNTTSFFTNADIRSFACAVGVGASLSDFESFFGTMMEISELINQTQYKIYNGIGELVQCEYAFFNNRFDEARSYAYNAILKASEYNQYSIIAFAENYLLQIALQEGDVALVKKILKQLSGHLDNPDFINRYLYHDLYVGFFYAKIGYLEKMPQWLIMEDKEMIPGLHLPVGELMTTVSYYIACKKYHHALAILCASYPSDKYERFLFGEIRFTLFTAVARFQTGDSIGAIECFKTAYNISFDGKFETFFIEQGREILPLITLLLKQSDCNIPVEWLKKIDRKASIYVKKTAIISAAFKNKVDEERISALSDREHDVLVDLYHGLSREEIALNQHLSINTVKKILPAIYLKLGANNSVDAVRIAIEENLIN